MSRACDDLRSSTFNRYTYASDARSLHWGYDQQIVYMAVLFYTIYRVRFEMIDIAAEDSLRVDFP
jgi:hypothetical protein